MSFFWHLLHFFDQLDRIEDKLEKLILGDKNMAATLQDVDAALAAQGTEITTLTGAVNAVDNDINTLLQKIAQGGDIDYTAELTKIQANTASVAAAVAAAQAADGAASGGDSSNFGQTPPAK